MSNTTTSRGATVDETTGEVLDVEPRRRRRILTDEERAVRDERAAHRRAMLAALETLSPALVVESDPPVREAGPPLIDVSRAREVAPLLRLPRVTGRGGPGSALIVSARDYDGRNGGEPTQYVIAYVEFHDGGSFKCRTRGVRLLRGDLRPLARALTTYADELDERDAPGRRDEVE